MVEAVLYDQKVSEYRCPLELAMCQYFADVQFTNQICKYAYVLHTTFQLQNDNVHLFYLIETSHLHSAQSVSGYTINFFQICEILEKVIF